MKGSETGNSEGDLSVSEDTDDDVTDEAENFDEERDVMNLE